MASPRVVSLGMDYYNKPLLVLLKRTGCRCREVQTPSHGSRLCLCLDYARAMMVMELVKTMSHDDDANDDNNDNDDDGDGDA